MSVLANRYLLIVTILFIIVINFSMVLNSNHLYQYLDIIIDNVELKDEDKKKSNQSIHSRDVVIDHEQSKLQLHLTAKNLILAFFG